MHRCSTASSRHQGGVVFLWLLFFIAGLGVALAAAATLWQSAVQRENESQLLFVGDQYRRAIESFWNAGDGQQRLPRTLDELLLDPRFPHTVRHLRRVYPDPMTGRAEWGLVKDQAGGIAGVHSLSETRPLKTANFPAAYQTFTDQRSVRDWVFALVSEENTTAGKATDPPGIRHPIGSDRAGGYALPAQPTETSLNSRQ